MAVHVFLHNGKSRIHTLDLADTSTIPCASQEALAVWNGKKVNVYEYSEDKSVIRAVGKL